MGDVKEILGSMRLVDGMGVCEMEIAHCLDFLTGLGSCYDSTLCVCYLIVYKKCLRSRDCVFAAYIANPNSTIRISNG
jgi:hypothetical protein